MYTWTQSKSCSICHGSTLSIISYLIYLIFSDILSDAMLCVPENSRLSSHIHRVMYTWSKLNHSLPNQGCVYWSHLTTWTVPQRIAQHLISLLHALCAPELDLHFTNVQSIVNIGESGFVSYMNGWVCINHPWSYNLSQVAVKDISFPCFVITVLWPILTKVIHVSSALWHSQLFLLALLEALCASHACPSISPAILSCSP
jgi:hypothetical protein